MINFPKYSTLPKPWPSVLITWKSQALWCEKHTVDSMVRSFLLDDRKVFGLVDHHVLMDEIGSLGLPDLIVSWVAKASSGPPIADQDSHLSV